MSSPAKTSNTEIIAAARQLIESRGVESLTMGALADAVGIRAPSLYKRYSGKKAILGAVEIELFGDLGQRIASALEAVRTNKMHATCLAYRDFAHDHPNSYKLMFSASSLQGEEPEKIRSKAVMPVIEFLTGLVGPTKALPAARTFTAFLHGFISMELGGAFHLKGDAEKAFRYGVASLQAGITGEGR